MLLVALLMLFLAKTMPAQFFYEEEVKAPDFEGVTIDGRSYHLYDSQAEYIIVCFWSADCSYCHDFLKSLRQNVDLENDYELVTFVLADSEKQARKKAKKLKLIGWHFYDEAGWDSPPFLDYDVNITPTIILIDKDKNKVGEAYDWEEFEGLIK